MIMKMANPSSWEDNVGVTDPVFVLQVVEMNFIVG